MSASEYSNIIPIHAIRDRKAAYSTEKGRFAMVPHALRRLRDGYALGVYTAIAMYANPNREAYPSIDTIKHDTGWSRSTIVRALDVLKAADLITVTRTGRSNRYRLAMAATDTSDVSPADANYNQELETPSLNDLVCATPDHEPETTPKTVTSYAVWEWWCDAHGLDRATKAPPRDLRHAKNLLAAGLDLDDLTRFLLWLKADRYWTGKEHTLGVMESQLSTWRVAAAKTTEPAPPTERELLERQLAFLERGDFTGSDILRYTGTHGEQQRAADITRIRQRLNGDEA